MVDDDLGDPCAHQVQQVPGDERAAAHLEQGFRAGVRQRTHAFAAPGGQDHGFHGAAQKV
jgi:hypothetical protein